MWRQSAPKTRIVPFLCAALHDRTPALAATVGVKTPAPGSSYYWSSRLTLKFTSSAAIVTCVVAVRNVLPTQVWEWMV